MRRRSRCFFPAAKNSRCFLYAVKLASLFSARRCALIASSRASAALAFSGSSSIFGLCFLLDQLHRRCGLGFEHLLAQHLDHCVDLGVRAAAHEHVQLHLLWSEVRTEPQEPLRVLLREYLPAGIT